MNQAWNSRDAIFDVTSSTPQSAGKSEFNPVRYKLSTLPRKTSTSPTDPDGYTKFFWNRLSDEIVQAQPGFPIPIRQPEENLYRIGPSKILGGGLGMFATRDMKMGEFILSERPLLVYPPRVELLVREGMASRQTEITTQSLRDETEIILTEVFSMMSSQSQDDYMNLHNGHPGYGCPIFGIAQTNGVAIGSELDLRFLPLEGQSERMRQFFSFLPRYSAVCKDLSRVNHSCRPNVQRKFDWLSISFRLYATKDISEGDEITRDYCNGHLLSEERVKQLAFYGFKCNCEVCLNHGLFDGLYAQLSRVPRFFDIPDVIRKGPVAMASTEKQLQFTIGLFEHQSMVSHAFYAKYATQLLEVSQASGSTEIEADARRKLKFVDDVKEDEPPNVNSA